MLETESTMARVISALILAQYPPLDQPRWSLFKDPLPPFEPYSRPTRKQHAGNNPALLGVGTDCSRGIKWLALLRSRPRSLGCDTRWASRERRTQKESEPTSNPLGVLSIQIRRTRFVIPASSDGSPRSHVLPDLADKATPPSQPVGRISPSLQKFAFKLILTRCVARF